MPDYVIKTARLGLRNWNPEDLDDLHEVSSNPQVMRHFPKVMKREETAAQLERFRQHYLQEGFTYYAADVLATGECIGFIGMARQTFEAEFTPCVDIGWRLKESAWGNGYATEGAKACLQHAFQELGLSQIYAVAVSENEPSFNVMRKIGMRYHGDFFHPALEDFPRLHRCKVFVAEQG